MVKRQIERKNNIKERQTKAHQRGKLLEPNRKQLLAFYPVFIV
jgi:hypothetical protein